MIVQVVVAIVLLAVAAGIAFWLERRRRPTTVPVHAPVPAHLERSDFPRPDAPWLVVVFSSSTCDGCGPMAEKARALESDDVAVAEVEYHEQRALHERYGIEAVPIVVVVDHDGVIYLMGRNGEYLGFMPPQTGPDRLTEILRKHLER